MKTEKKTEHSLPMGVLDFELAGDTVFAACMDGLYRIHLASGDSEQLFAHRSYLSGIVVADESTLVCSSYDGQLIWYDAKARQVFRRVQAHQFWSWQLAISPDRQRVASVTGQYLAGSERYEPAAEKEPSLKIYDVGTGTLLHSLSHVPSVQSVAFSHDGRFVAAGNLMGEVRVWSVQDGQLVANWTTDSFTSWGIIKSHCYIGGIYALAFDPSDEHLVLAGMGPMRDPMAGNGRQLWQRFAWQQEPVKKLDETHQRESGEGLMETLAWHPSGEHFVMGGRQRGGDWNAAVFSNPDGEKVAQLSTGIRITSAQFSQNGTELWLGGADKQEIKGEAGERRFPDFGRLQVFSV